VKDTVALASGFPGQEVLMKDSTNEALSAVWFPAGWTPSTADPRGSDAIISKKFAASEDAIAWAETMLKRGGGVAVTREGASGNILMEKFGQLPAAIADATVGGTIDFIE
jgi:hypothetical protein